MPELIRFSRQVGDRLYDVALTWETESFEDGTPRIAVAAGVAPARDPDNRTSLFAAITLEAREEGSPDLVFRVQDVEVLRTPLEELVDESIVDAIPSPVFGAGDPILGCLVRAGLSAAVAQVLACRDATQEHRWFKPRARAIGRCLRTSAGDMAARMVAKTVRCFLL